MRVRAESLTQLARVDCLVATAGELLWEIADKEVMTTRCDLTTCRHTNKAEQPLKAQAFKSTTQKSSLYS